MQNTLKLQAAEAASSIRTYFSNSQLSAMAEGCRGKEKAFFMQKFVDLAKTIDNMPFTYGQDGLGDQAIAFLHYFAGDSDWFVTEKDIAGGTSQAFGYVILNGDVECAELGYISITELTSFGIELDLYFTPCSLAELKAKRTSKIEICAGVKPWVIVCNPGMEDETVLYEFSTHGEAANHFALYCIAERHDIMKRCSNGSLTTEF